MRFFVFLACSFATFSASALSGGAVGFEVDGTHTGSLTTIREHQNAPAGLNGVSFDGDAAGFFRGAFDGGRGYSISTTVERLFFIDGFGVGQTRTNSASIYTQSTVSVSNLSNPGPGSGRALSQGDASFQIDEAARVRLSVDWSGAQSPAAERLFATGQVSVFAIGAGVPVVDLVDFDGNGKQAVTWDLVFEDSGFLELSYFTNAFAEIGASDAELSAFAELSITLDVLPLPAPGGATVLFTGGLLLVPRRRRVLRA